MESRSLSYDERKAAEAAFQGLPVDPKWSASARGVYEGILHALQEKGAPALSEPRSEPDDVAETPIEDVEREREERPPVRLMNRQEAIDAGILIDVSPIAEDLGLRLSVGISRPLWELGIASSQPLADDECQNRVRDVLLALRLHIEQNELTGPWIKFPALLAIPPEAVPQLCSLVAIAHQDPTTPQALTVMLPEEVSGISVSE